MIRMSKLTDYGIVLMVNMVRANEARTARQLAAESDLPLPTVAKVLKVLTRQGFLGSTRGVHGGYSLSRRADQISISDLIEGLEGPIALTECSAAPGDGVCSHEETCPVRAPWVQINRAVKDALAGICLAQMAEPQFLAPVIER
jgi:FeS assembly SUF system regulator